jgi:hypothetical protein
MGVGQPPQLICNEPYLGILPDKMLLLACLSEEFI